ncbi:MAG: hypothetical protein KJ064_00970 [Anaerolineae bacterium]|nr:hypothetical protein [Anaerolineae bacterium]
MTRKVVDSALVVIGFILSPLSWWNDLVVNVPLAYLFSLPFTLLHESLFLPAFIIGYWLTNLLGFLLMHVGFSGMRDFKQALFISLLYTLLVAMLVIGGMIPPLTHLLTK